MTPRVPEILNNAYTPFGAIITAEIDKVKVFEDIMFSISRRFDVANNDGTYDIIINTTTEKSYLVFEPIAFSATGGGRVLIDLYMVPTYTGGTSILPINRNNESLKTADVAVKMGVTVSNTGTALPIQFQINSNGISAVASIGGSTSENLVFAAKRNTDYLIRLTNKDTVNDAHCTIAANWYEVSGMRR